MCANPFTHDDLFVPAIEPQFAGKGWFCGPLQPLLDKTWVLPDIEKVE